AQYLSFRSCSLFGLYVSQSIHFRLPDCAVFPFNI
ncbi:uncharacterized protein METZ01_LOCUS509316, partial [marine metagenome]